MTPNFKFHLFKDLYQSRALTFQKNFFIICFNGSPSKMIKNAFYIILKALSVLKMFEFLSWLFGHVEKTP